MALQVTTSAGELKINSVSMHTAAWRVTDVGKLAFDSPLRGSYVVTPGVDGATVVPMRNDAAQWSLEFVMIGDCDHTGAAFANKQEGFYSNLNYLNTNVLTGRNLTGNRTRAATLTIPGEGTDRTADIHCWLEPGEVTTNYWTATLEIRIPAGAFL